MSDLKDYIQVYNDVITKESCDHFISLYDSSDAKHMKTPAYDFGEINMFESKVFNIYSKQITQLMSGVYQRYSSQYKFFPKTNAFEQPRIKRYEPNKGVFDWNCDATTKWQYPHKGCTPISGPKYVISSYVQI